MTAPIDTLVTVFGGSGFLGRHVVRALAQRDYRLRVGVRRPELAGHLQPLGKVGQINPVQANIRYPASIEAAMRGAHVVVNLVGILSEGGAQRCNRVHAHGAHAIAEAAAKTNFKSREAKPAAVPAPVPVTAPTKPVRRHRTGRSAQLNLKVRPDTIEKFYAVADANGWVLGEAFERAVALLEQAQQTKLG